MICQTGRTIVSMELEPITAVWRRSPSGVQGRAPVGGQRGEAPLKLKVFCPFSHKRGAKR